MSRWLPVALLVGTLGLPASAQCVTTNGFYPTSFDLVSVAVSAGVPNNVRHGVQLGLDKWNSSSECNGGYDDFPYLDINDSAPKLTFGYVDGLGPLADNGDTTCARTTFFSGGAASVTLYSQTKLAADGNTYPCPSDEAGISFMAAHEAGHYLGLDDSSCAGYMMSAMHGVYGAGTINWTYPASKPRIEECEKADDITTTPDEEENECTEGENICSGWGNQSPLILDFDGNGFRFSGWPDVVTFDIDDDGYHEVVAWTGRDEADAFLVLDRDGNGTIDSGRELFGDATPLADGRRAPDGFTALAELDRDESGAIDAGDEAFARLRLWLDSDHNAIAAPHELIRLETAGVVSIELDAVISERRDRHGNRLRYSGRFWQRDGYGRAVPRQVTDVFFVGY